MGAGALQNKAGSLGGVYSGGPPQATEPGAGWAVGGRSPEASGSAGTPYSPLAYQEDYSTSAFPAIPFDDDSTDSETFSDNDREELPELEIPQMTQAESAEHIYVHYRRAERTWRSFTGEPVRKFRRHVHMVNEKKQKQGKDAQVHVNP